MKIIQIVLVASAVLLTTEATHFRKLITSYGPSVQTQHQVLHSEPQPIASPPEPAPVFEHTEEVNPALLPPPSLFSIQPVAHYVLPQPFYSLPLLHAGAYATADASAGASAFLLHPQAAYESALRHASRQDIYHQQDIHHQHLVNEAQRQSAFYAGAQSQSNTIRQHQQGIPSNQYGFPQQAFDADAQAQSNSAASVGLQTQAFIQNQYGPPEAADSQTNDAAALQQQRVLSQNQFRPQQAGFHDVENQNFNAAVQNNAAETFENQHFAAPNPYGAPQEQGLSLQNFNNAQNSAAANSVAASSGQNQPLFTPTAASGQQVLPYAASATTSTASAHSSSVVNHPVSTIASHSSSFTTSSSASSSSNLITPYTIPSSSGSSSSAVANIADNLIVPSASYGAPQ